MLCIFCHLVNDQQVPAQFTVYGTSVCEEHVWVPSEHGFDPDLAEAKRQARFEAQRKAEASR